MTSEIEQSENEGKVLGHTIPEPEPEKPAYSKKSYAMQRIEREEIKEKEKEKQKQSANEENEKAEKEKEERAKAKVKAESESSKGRGVFKSLKMQAAEQKQARDDAKLAAEKAEMEAMEHLRIAQERYEAEAIAEKAANSTLFAISDKMRARNVENLCSKNTFQGGIEFNSELEKVYQKEKLEAEAEDIAEGTADSIQGNFN